MPDFTYRADGEFVQLLPENPAAVAAWNDIAAQTDGTGKILAPHWPAVARQLRAAGYSVRKARPVAESDSELLRGLGM
jgi:hypothetical protein